MTAIAGPLRILALSSVSLFSQDNLPGAVDVYLSVACLHVRPCNAKREAYLRSAERVCGSGEVWVSRGKGGTCEFWTILQRNGAEAFTILMCGR